MQEAVVLKKPLRESVHTRMNPVMRWSKPIEEDEEWLYALVAKRIERIENGTAKYISFEEILAKEGLTFDDLDAMEDVEIE